MEVIHGRNLILSQNGNAIAGAKSCRLQISSEEIEKASSTQQLWTERIAGRRNWSVACDHLLPKTGTPMKTAAAMVGTFVTLTLTTALSGDTLTGNALVKSWDVSGAIGTLAVGSFQFTGNGAIG